MRRISRFVTFYAVNPLLLLSGKAVTLGEGARGRILRVIEVESVDVRQAALHHHPKRTVQSKSAEGAMGWANAKDIATTEDLPHLVIGDIRAIDGLLAVELKARRKPRSRSFVANAPDRFPLTLWRVPI